MAKTFVAGLTLMLIVWLFVCIFHTNLAGDTSRTEGLFHG
jgi:hypothetical protein